MSNKETFTILLLGCLSLNGQPFLQPETLGEAGMLAELSCLRCALLGH